ncbi:anthranilate phosphoribosyltransferase [Ophidiomyces ophidiicola]|uniref:anthranilate phosphoribosyltransferase n=1 Tax=Ophidiomyces ophidiicola TaxID=1387563 RepID=UPI0020C402DD|nr:anthranilate phosphoribosyltransferase [Ophidiomyces ophidiicola]KAI1909536.1 anthranilate phosphoribosyltransferase [Ophidiomyces ophidiicola]KAI1933513.1 anthranilate phosphoribosyltransferase [Ophidiomyces ophidiicola]KAI1946835.1 anthranilate phosphoribosyltransferase [Ophidiomyces ophidiicola]KAI2000256.1 anthranilate phosphoribosyltransferase [Ophidiomyces ophidiicola]KAI2004161.1 anthranilate phosphoribosyltransferase [Ophidiomyces ophidiicola]
MEAAIAKPEPISISPLLQRLAYPDTAKIQVSATEIASAFALIFEDRLSMIQTAALLTLLHSTGLDKDSDVIAQCANRMREAAQQTEKAPLRKVLRARGRKEGTYRGGLCDIVGTGGDQHSTFNISTTSSIIASPLLMIAKHGNRAQTSFSGSADVLNSIAPTPPNISAVNAGNLSKVLEETNYAFLFAPNFHPGMMYANPVRRGLGLRTIFNLMGPLANPVEWALEARVVGVAYQSLGPVFANALRLSGAKNALIICGEEDLDEISCAGKTNCWRLSGYPNPEYKGNEDLEDGDTSDDEGAPSRTLVKLDIFQIQPSDFGLPSHPLSDVGGGRPPRENAQKLMSILRNELARDDPILDFVLMNVAALLVISGVCEADTSNMGPGDDGNVITERGPGGLRWKEGVRRARWAIESGEALKCLEKFIDVTNRL